MSFVILVLAILFLCGVNVGIPLAICAIIHGVCRIICQIMAKVKESVPE